MRPPATKAIEVSIDDDEYARALAAMTAISEKPLKDIPYIEIEGVLTMISAALDGLAISFQAVQGVKIVFEFVKTFVMTAGENRRRVAALHLKQAEMICELFEIRHIRDDGRVVNGETFPSRLQALCQAIQSDISWLGNVMQKYAEESRFARVLKSQQWQAVIEQCSSRCEGRKREIVRALSLYTATRVDGILDGVAQANAKLAKILKIFALFEPSSRMEEQLNAEILARGGADVCLASDEKLNALASLKCAMDDGPNMIYLAGKGRKLTYGELRKIRSPVEKELANNLARFERKLDDASLKLDKAIKHLRTLTTRPYQKIEDPDIRKLWRDMGWGGSVESQTFVLNLYDYFIDLVREAHGSPSSGDAAESSPIPAVVPGSTPETSLIVRPASPTPSDTGTEADREEFEGRTTPEKASEDAWCLRYFKYTTVSTFMEVIDNDANGLIKIKEVNEFVASRPGDISLMQWLAYCAYGWVVAIYIYRLRTEWLLEQMLSLDYTKENSTAFVSYTESLIWIVGYLRSINEPVLDEQRLLRLVHDIMRTHEKSLGEELSRLEYDISGPSTMSLLGASINERAGGTERVESYILPIFYLCMRHHFDIMRLSTFYVLDESEFDTATSTVQQIGSALRSRLDGLHAHFQKMQEDLGQKFRYFATGMFGDMHSLVWNFSTPETLDKMVTGWCLPWTSQRALEWPLRDYDDPLGLVFHDYNPSDRHPDRTLFPKIPVPELLGDAPSDEEYGRLMGWRAEYGLRLIVEHEHNMTDNISTNVTEHYQVSCDGCGTVSLVGVRFKCVDCPDFDYCSNCYLTPPILNPERPATHHSNHRFLAIEKAIPWDLCQEILAMLLTWQDSRLRKLTVHGLSCDLHEARRLLEELAIYLHVCSSTADDEDDCGIEHMVDLNSALSRIESTFPQAAEYAKYIGSTSLRRQKKWVPTHYGIGCDGPGCPHWSIEGPRYKCVDCPNFDYCSDCYQLRRQEHNQDHRFALLRYPTPRFLVRRFLAYFRRDATDRAADLATWVEDTRNKLRVGVPQTRTVSDEPAEENVENDSDVTEVGDLARPRCRGECRNIIEGDSFKCLLCSSDQDDFLLCTDCAFTTDIVEKHRATHILVLVREEETSSEAARDYNAHYEEDRSPELVAVSRVQGRIDSVEQRMKQMEENMESVLSQIADIKGLIMGLTQYRPVY